MFLPRFFSTLWLACVLVACGEDASRPREQVFDPSGQGGGGATGAGSSGSSGSAEEDAAVTPEPDGGAQTGGESSGTSSGGSTGQPDASTEPEDAGTKPPADAGPEAPFDPGPNACGELGFRATDAGAEYVGTCEGASLLLLPTAKIGGTWYGAGRTGPCKAEGAHVRCGAGALGQIGVEIEEGKLRAYWEAGAKSKLEAIGLTGKLVLPGAQAVLSNGFQSWSQSGVLKLGDKPTNDALQTALSARGEDEVYRKGAELSHWYTFAGGGAVSLVAGALSADTMRSFTQVFREGSALGVLFASGGGAFSLATDKQVVRTGEWFQVAIGPDLEAMLRRYGESLATRKRTHPVAAPVGWNSWYDLWDDVRADDVVVQNGKANADFAKEILTPLRAADAEPLWIVVDDGWQKAWGDWTENQKFSAGLPALATAIRARGMEMGLWFAPFLVDPDTALARMNPDWLVGGVTYDHPAHGQMRVLDVTHPAAAAHLEAVVKRIVAAGIGLLKIDFLFAGTWEGTRREAVTGMQAYQRGLDLIRKAAGEQTRIIAVGAPPLTTIAYADAWRVGNDIAFKPVPIINFPRPTWTFIANQARQLAARFPYCLATLCDGDPALLRELGREQVEAGSWVAAAAGGAMFLSDDLRELANERKGWGLDAERMAFGVSGVPAVPERFYPDALPSQLVNMKDNFNLFNAEHDVPNVWRLPDGSRIAFNFKSGAITVEGVSIPEHAVRKLP